jgi:glycosyltransferase involved in cell wall biosynthesis
VVRWAGKSAKGYITDGTDGLVVDAGDVEALRSKIIFLLNDISLAKKIGENAQKKAQQP